MEAFKRFEAICRAMADPAIYPHSVSRLERRDTHISAVFLTGKWVYKLKKPVDFGFLNFTDLDARRHFCEREVHLNQRLSRNVYEGVVKIGRDDAGRLTLEGPGEIVEYAVKMRQLPENVSLKSLLKRQKVHAKLLRDLGHHLAAFYEQSAQNDQIAGYGRAGVIEFNMEENFRQVDPFVGDWVQKERWEFIREVSRAFFKNWSGLFDHRVDTGRIRDGHGDLRTEHIYFFRGIQIIDCIEFNDRFRYGDAVIDLAYLHMDMEHEGYRDLSRLILAAYAERAADPELYALIDFYSAYRAIVRLKVACLRSTEEDEGSLEQIRLKTEVGDYLQEAYRYALQFSRPTLWVFCGLPATGKSALAERTAQALSLSLFQSDCVRREMEQRLGEKIGVMPYGEGIYREELRHRVYAQMLILAQEQLKNGRSAVLDASFSRSKWRDEARQLAVDLDTNLIVVECVCSEETMRVRLREREAVSGASDARLLHLPQMITNFEPLREFPEEVYLRLNTDRPFSEAFGELLSEGYAKKCAQIQGVLHRL